MSEDVLKRQAIDRMIAAAEHIRDCERCRRLYGVAFDTVLEPLRERNPTLYWEFPFAVLEECLGELRDCEDWPEVP